MLKAFHIALAYLTVAGFIIRGVWALQGSPLREEPWVQAAPHVIDTLLLTLAVLTPHTRRGAAEQELRSNMDAGDPQHPAAITARA